MKISHVGLHVRNLEAMKDFYCRHFGALAGQKFETPASGFQAYYLRFSSGAELEIMTKPSILPDGNAKPYFGQMHLAFVLDSLEEQSRLVDAITLDGGAKLVGPVVVASGYTLVKVADPEGNEIELLV